MQLEPIFVFVNLWEAKQMKIFQGTGYQGGKRKGTGNILLIFEGIGEVSS